MCLFTLCYPRASYILAVWDLESLCKQFMNKGVIMNLKNNTTVLTSHSTEKGLNKTLYGTLKYISFSLEPSSTLIFYIDIKLIRNSKAFHSDIIINVTNPVPAHYVVLTIRLLWRTKSPVPQAPITRTTRTIKIHALDWLKCSTQNTPTPFNQSSACIFIVLVVVLFVGACVTGPLVHPSYFSKYLKYRGKARRGCNMLRWTISHWSKSEHLSCHSTAL